MTKKFTAILLALMLVMPFTADAASKPSYQQLIRKIEALEARVLWLETHTSPTATVAPQKTPKAPKIPMAKSSKPPVFVDDMNLCSTNWKFLEGTKTVRKECRK